MKPSFLHYLQQGYNNEADLTAYLKKKKKGGYFKSLNQTERRMGSSRFL